MAYTLNTAHPLYGNLIELIGVQSGALVSHKTARTFTKHADASYGSGTYGEHFRAAGASYTNKGASFTPELAVNTVTTTNYTVVTVLNGSGANESSLSLGVGSAQVYGPGLAAGKIKGIRGTSLGSTSLGTGARMLTLCRIGETAEKLYYDAGNLDYSGTALPQNYNDSGASSSYIGSVASGATCNLDIVWEAVFNKELSSAEISDLFGSLGAGNTFGLVLSGDSTAPTLSSASVTAVGTTTGTGNVTTNEGNGTLYSIVSTSATAPSAAQIQAGQNHTGAAAVWSGNQAVSSTGAKNFSITGLTASTSYYAHFQHKDSANNNSTVVTSAQFTTLTPDSTNPTMTGSVTISAKTTTSYTATWSAGSDNVAVTGYEYRLNAGSWVDLGNVLTTNISARTPGATDTFEVRAYDAAANKSSALSQSVTLYIGTITITDVTQWETNVARPSNTGITVDISNISTGALVVRKTGQVTTAGSDMEIKDALIAGATLYQVVLRFADGSVGVEDITSSLT